MTPPGPGRGRFYYGWVIVAIGMLTLTSSAATAPPVFTQFNLPMTKEFGWSRTLYAGAFSVGTVGVALVSPIVGRLLDRYGSRPVITVGAFVLGGALLLLGTTQGLARFYLGYALARSVSMGVLGLGVTTAIANWFIQKRGRTMALANMGRGLGASTMPLIAHFLILSAGWRRAWLVLGGLVWGLLILPAALFLRRRPEDMGLRPDGVAEAPSSAYPTPGNPYPGPALGGETTWTLREAIKTPALWLLTLAELVRGLSAPGIGVHLKPYLMDRGLSPTAAAGVVSLEAAFIGLGGLAWGSLVEKLPIRHVMAAVLFLNAGWVLLLLQVREPSLAFFIAVVYGLGLGGTFTLEAVIMANYFGRKSIGTIMGFIMPFQMAGTATGPLLSGIVYDLTGRYDAAFTIFALGWATSATAVFLARPPRKGP